MVCCFDDAPYHILSLHALYSWFAVFQYGDLELTLINLYNENGELSTRLAATVRQVDSLLDSAADVQGTVAQLSDKVRRRRRRRRHLDKSAENHLQQVHWSKILHSNYNQS